MSSAESLREFISQRLTAAAAEIFSEFEKTIVQYEEEIDRQRRLLDITFNPQIKLQRTDLQQDLIFKEEDGGPDQQLCNQDRNSSLDQKEPEPPRIKEELEEEQLVLKEEAEVVMVTPTSDETNDNGPEPNMDRLFYQTTVVDENQNQEETDHEDSELTRNEDLKPKKRHDGNRSDSDNVDKCPTSEGLRSTDAGKPSLNCEICGKSFHNRYLKTHLKIHTGDRQYSCKICDKSFIHNSRLLVHMRSHTGEKPYSCKTCGKKFTIRHHLIEHVRTHTQEKPFSCKTCGEMFSHTSNLSVHMRIHTGEKPYSCTICHKRFAQRNNLICHNRTHTGEKPYSCQICGKSFSRNAGLSIHKRKSCR